MESNRAGASVMGWFVVLVVAMVACVTDAPPSTSGWWVGPAGGEFTDPTTGVTLRVPAGAFNETVQVRVEDGAVDSIALDLGDRDVTPLAAVRLLPDGLQLNAPVEVIMPLLRPLEPGRALAPLAFDPARGLWGRDTGGSLPPAAARVTEDGRHAALRLWHFSGHGAGESTFEWGYIGEPVGGLHHLCHVSHLFGVWDGPPFTGWAGARYGDEGFRRSVFADVFESLLLRSDVETAEASVGLVDRALDATSVGEDAIELSYFSNTVLRGIRWSAGTIGGLGSSYRNTTLRNVAGAFDRFSILLHAVDGAALARTRLTDAAGRATLLFVISEGMEEARIETLRASAARAGLLVDPAVSSGLDEAIRRVHARREAANQGLGELWALGRSLVDVDALIDAGVYFAQVVVSRVQTYLRIGSLAARRLTVLASTALEALVGNYKIHRRQSELCALATVLVNVAPLARDDLAADELYTATYATFSGKAAALLRDNDLGPFVETARALGTAIGRAIRWLMGADEGYTAGYWDDQFALARSILDRYQAEGFGGVPIAPPPMPPPTPPETPPLDATIVVGGASVLEWPFEAPTWAETLGSEFHRCSDLYARDMNTTLGGGNTEIRLGPMFVLAPAAGIVRFAGPSVNDPGRGHQLLIESERVPGFFVSLAHLQAFRTEGWVGRRVRAGERLAVAVGNTGTTYSHLHIVAYQRVLAGEARARVLRGQSPEGYDCGRSSYAALFTLRAPSLSPGVRPTTPAGVGDAGVRDAGGRPDAAAPTDRPQDIPPTVDVPPPDVALDATVPSMDAPPSCSGPHRMICGVACVDTWTDSDHCGRCGTSCSPSQRCELGACVAVVPPTDATVPCSGAHRMTCGVACADTWTDSANCGRCGTRCSTGQHCDTGTCVADPPPCSGAHRMTCGAACVDTWTDSANCGRCGTRCSAGQRCDLGACVAVDPCASVSCPDCQTCRSGACAAVSDFTPCPSGRVCRGGACVAPCATNYCETYRYDAGAWCDGSAIVRCATSGLCRVETSRVTCPTTCVAGACTPCPTNFADCDGIPSNGCEADLRTSAANCGTCRVACGSGVACHGGSCDGSAVKIALGNAHSCALTTLGTAQCWGENVAGELGNGAAFPLRNELTPVGVVDLTDATDLAGARTSTCAVRAGGAVVCWGHNDAGQLGTGAGSSMWRSHFVSAVGIANARQITAGWDHVCVATTADAVLCWGLNLDGRLGDGTTTTRASPVPVAGLTNVAQVEAGPMHTCAVRRDGTVACWGFGSTGRLGTGTYDDQLRPAAVTGVSNASAVACSRFATCVLRADATVACTGGNDNGELGDGTMTRRPTMAPVPGLTDVSRLAMGDTHACVVRRDGSVWCWGRNNAGQLGDGTTTTRLVPTRVQGIAGALQVDAGGAHTCALLAGGRIACWGTNAAGQLGDGTTANRSVPVSVVLR